MCSTLTGAATPKLRESCRAFRSRNYEVATGGRSEVTTGVKVSDWDAHPFEIPRCSLMLALEDEPTYPVFYALWDWQPVQFVPHIQASYGRIFSSVRSAFRLHYGLTAEDAYAQQQHGRRRRCNSRCDWRR